MQHICHHVLGGPPWADVHLQAPSTDRASALQAPPGSLGGTPGLPDTRLSTPVRPRGAHCPLNQRYHCSPECQRPGLRV